MMRAFRQETSQKEQVGDVHREYFICNLSYDERPRVRLSERSLNRLVPTKASWYTYSLIDTMPKPTEHLLAALHSCEEFWDIFGTRVHVLGLAIVDVQG